MDEVILVLGDEALSNEQRLTALEAIALERFDFETMAKLCLKRDWKKFDVLPVIPVFNIANALGVPFVDKTVRVEALGKAIVAGLVDEEVSGVQRFPQIESLAEAL